MAVTEANQKAKAADFLQRVLETDLSCAICQDVYINPIQLNCSHSFCKFCVYRWLSRHTGCPSCRMTVTWQGENLALRNIINRLIKETSKEFQKNRANTVNQRREDEQSREEQDRQIVAKDDMSDEEEEEHTERIGLFSDSDETEDEDADDENDDDYLVEEVDEESDDEDVDIQEDSDDEMDQDDNDDDDDDDDNDNVSTSSDSSENLAEFFHSDSDLADLSFYSDAASNSDDTIVIQTDDDDSDNSSVEQISSSDSDQNDDDDDDDDDDTTDEEETEEEEEMFEVDNDDDEEDEFYSHWDRYSEDSNVMYGTSDSSEVDSDSTASYTSQSEDDESF